MIHRSNIYVSEEIDNLLKNKSLDSCIELAFRFRNFCGLEQNNQKILHYFVNNEHFDKNIVNYITNNIPKSINSLDSYLSKNTNELRDKLYEKLLLINNYDSDLFKPDTHNEYYNIKKPLFNLLLKHINLLTITDKNIAACSRYGSVLYTKIKEYYKNSQSPCTHTELYIMIESLQLKTLISIPSVAVALSNVVSNAKFGLTSDIITLKNIKCKELDIDIKEYVWMPYMYYEIENLSVLLDNKCKITLDTLEKCIDSIHNKTCKKNYMLAYNVDSYIKNDVIKKIIDKCIFTVGFMTYNIFKKLMKIGIHYENYKDYGIVLKDDISESFNMGICPTFINPKEINFTDGAIVDILSRDKSIIHLRKFCAKNKFENMKSCLEGILKNCRPSNIKSVRYLICEKKTGVTPEMFKKYLAENDQIASLLWERINELYDLVKKPDTMPKKDTNI